MRNFVILLLLPALAAVAQEGEPTVARFYDFGVFNGQVPSLRRSDERPHLPLGSYTVPWRETEGGIDGEEAEMRQEVIDLLARVAGELSCEALAGGMLRVEGTEAQHKVVQRTFDTLVQQGKTPMEIEVRSLSIPSSSIDEGLRRELALAASIDDTMAQRLAALDSELGRRSGTLVVMPGSWGSYQAVRRSSYVSDFAVEIAQGRSIADPIAGVIREGVAIALRPHLLEDGTVLARVIASSGKLDPPLRRFRSGTTDLGDIELADFRGSAVSTELILRSRAYTAVVLGAPQSSRGGPWEILLLRLRQAPEAWPLSNLSVLPVGALTANDFGMFYGWGEDQQLGLMPMENAPRLDLGEVTARIQGQEESEFLIQVQSLHGGALVLLRDPARTKVSKGTIAALETALLRPARMNLRLLSVGPRALPDETTPLTGLLSVPVLAGRLASFATYLAREHVADYDVEVAQDARISDPLVHAAYGGVFANLLLSQLGPRSFRVRLDMRLLGVDEEIREVAHGAKEVGPVQDIASRMLLIAPTFDLPAGAVKTIEIGPDPNDPSGTRRLVLVASLLDG